MIIGICGGTASGKTIFAKKILEIIGAESIIYLEHDAYYLGIDQLPTELQEERNFDHPDSLDNHLFIQHLKMLQANQPIERPVYDFTVHRRTSETIRILPRPIILVDGILIFAEPELRKFFDVKIYVDTADDIRFIRRLQRDINERGRTVPSVIEQYQKTVRPMHRDFVEPSKRYADVIIPEGGFNIVAMDMVVARVQALLEAK